MNKLDIFKAMNLIDDDIVKEAAETSETATESEVKANDNNSVEVTVSGVERYRNIGWKKYSALASAFLLLIGLGATGAVYIKDHGTPSPDDDNIITENVTTTTETSEETESNSEEASEKTSEKSTKKTSKKETATTKDSETEKPTEKNTEKTVQTKKDNDINTTVKTEEKNTATATAPTTDRKTTPIRTTVKTTVRTTVKTTVKTTAKTEKTQAQATTATSTPSHDTIADLKDIRELAKKGMSLKWSDLEQYEYYEVESAGTARVYNIGSVAETGHCLLVTGHYPDSINECVLFPGQNRTSYNRSDGVDIRTEDVDAFIQEVSHISGIIYTLENLKANSIRRINVSSTAFKDKRISLSYEQIGKLVSILKTVKPTRISDGYLILSSNYSYIDIDFNNNDTKNIEVIGNYIVIDGTGYKVEGNSCKELSSCVFGMLNASEPDVITVEEGTVYKWRDFLTEKSDYMYQFSESITLTNFPDVLFSWNGHDSRITVEKNGKVLHQIYGMPIWNAFFTDLNGDSYPELCTTMSVGSGIVDERLYIYDIHNDGICTVSDRMNNNFIFREIANEKLVVYKKPDTSEWGDFEHDTTKGTISLGENGGITFEDGTFQPFDEFDERALNSYNPYNNNN